MGIIANLTPITGVFLASQQIMAFFFTKSCNQALGILSTNRVVKIHTFPETNSLPLKIGHPKRKLVFQPSTFRCYDSFREGNVVFWGPSRQRSSLTAAKKIQLPQSQSPLALLVDLLLEVKKWRPGRWDLSKSS